MLKKRLLILFILLGFIGFGAVFYMIEEEWVDFSTLTQLAKRNPSVLLDSEGKVISYFEVDRREDIPFNKIPKVLVKAFLAAEDHDFFEHRGISFKGILRSIWVNLKSFRKSQGASTITQQVARLLFLNTEKTFLRKFREMILAIQLEKQLTKEQIFELYVNNMYFGRGTYGVQAASKRFWGKTVNEINVAEAATLATVAKSAKYFSPLNDIERCKKGRNVILFSMKNLGMISQKDFDYAQKTEIKLSNSLIGSPIRLYIQEWVRVWAENKWGKDILYNKGLKIHTSINLKMQEAAERSFVETMGGIRGYLGNNINGALVAMDSHTGQIRALVAGYNFNESQFNRAFLAVRQMGSSFKPIIYAAALQSGLTMRTTFVDEPISMLLPNGDTWEPKNYDGNFLGRMTLLKALTISDNMVMIKTLLETGYDNVISLAQNLGLSRQLLKYPTLALGITEATPVESAAAFNVFANNGTYVEPYFIESVKDSHGNSWWQASQPIRRKVLNSTINSKMVHALSWRMRRARNNFPEWIDAESIGKTGTTNDSTSNWFVGSTPGLTTAVYIGRDDGKGMGKDIYGNQTSFPIWLNFYKRINLEEKSFYIDPGLKEVAIDWSTGENAGFIHDNETASVLE